jgi:hypothetical protein
MAARELSTSWLHNRAMLGMQAALLCLSQGDIKAAREWLEGTTDEAVAEMPDDMTPDGLQLWYDGYMRSSDGKNGFLTREESLIELGKSIPRTSVLIAALQSDSRAKSLDQMESLEQRKKLAKINCCQFYEEDTVVCDFSSLS